MTPHNRWWVVRHVLNEPGLKGVICIGRGRRPETAWKDYSRKYNWYKKGCPGMPMWHGNGKRVKGEKREEDDNEAVREVGHGQEGRQKGTGSGQRQACQGQ